MALLNSSALILLTGNGLTLSEDLARRFISIEIDPEMEDPESRVFMGDILAETASRRAELLAAVLTVWRWGRQNSARLKVGKALGSFEQWCRWCRDPLLTLGCGDPVEHIGAAKANDPHRQMVRELFATWHAKHGEAPVKVADLDEAVKAIADPAGRGRQYLARFIGTLTGARVAGFILKSSPGVGRQAAAYSVRAADSRARSGITHPGHPGHNAPAGAVEDHVRQRGGIWV